MQTFSAPTAVRSASGAQTDRVCSRKTQLAVLLALDAFVVVGMIFATMVQFVKTGSTDVTLSSSSGSGNTAKFATWLLYLIYMAAFVYGISSVTYTIFAIFGQEARIKAWEASHMPETGADAYGNALPVYGFMKSAIPNMPRNKCIDATRYFYSVGWILAWVASAVGVLVTFFGSAASGFFGSDLRAQTGAKILIFTWILLTVIGIWRIIEKIASSSG